MELEASKRCINQQLEELEMLGSIYCNPGELQLLDAGVVADLNEFLQSTTLMSLRAHLEYIIKLSIPGQQSVDVRIELPHFYPLLELARISVHTALLDKVKEQQLKNKIENFLKQREAEEPYIYQLLSWLQEQIESLLSCPSSSLDAIAQVKPSQVQNLQRIWVYSHHIKSSSKRQEIIRQARQLQLSGFSRPGKPGIICAEGESDKVQEYWRLIKGLRWHKISLVKTEERQRKRLFENFTEQLFNDTDSKKREDGVMNMGQFIKFLEAHGTGYMKSELFGLD